MPNNVDEMWRLGKGMQVQTEYVQGTKITELYSNLCKDCYKPLADVIDNKPS